MNTLPDTERRIVQLSLFEEEEESPTLSSDDSSANYSDSQYLSRSWSSVSCLESLPLPVVSYIDSLIAERYDSLSVRTRNCLAGYNSLAALLPYIPGVMRIRYDSIYHCGKRSALEFETFLDDVRTIVDEEYRRFSESDGSLYSYLRHEVLRLFPFLSDEEDVDFVVDAYDRGNRSEPALFLLHRFVLSDQSTRGVIARSLLLRPVSEAGKCLSELAYKLDLSRERVRQLSVSRYPLPPALVEALSPILAYNPGAFVSSSLPMWSELASVNNLPGSPELVMKLVALINPDFVLRDFSQSGANLFLVRKDLLSGIREMDIYNSIISVAKQRRCAAEVIDLLPIVSRCCTASKEPEDIESLCALYAEAVGVVFDVCFLPPTSVELQPNKVDVISALQSVIAEAGRAVSFDELWDAMAQRHPEIKFRNRNSMRSYIQRSESILPKGRSGMYVLAGWEGEFTGSIPDYLYHLLSECESPLSIDSLFELCREQFPRTTRSSILTFLLIDRKKRFVQFEDSMFGLAEKEYPGCKAVVKQSVSRKSPDERIVDFEAFVLANKRFPFANSNDYNEISIYRWQTNIRSGNIVASDELRKRLDDLYSAFPDYPRTVDELKFVERCNNVRKIFESFRRLPSSHSEPLEYQWYRKTSRDYDSLSSVRKIHFDRLMADIETISNGGLLLF